MEYDRGESFPFEFEPNGIPFGSKFHSKSNLKFTFFFQSKIEWKTNHHNFIPFNLKKNGRGNLFF